jgi:hypothetical protein
MTGIREAYARFKALKKATRGTVWIIANDQDTLDHVKWQCPGGSIYVVLSDEGDLELVWEGK